MATREPHGAPAAHPLAVAAVVTLVLNDFVLKDRWPGLVTGKLSDVAWLVLAPLVVAAALGAVGMSRRVARGLALVGVGGLFTLLQLWPPLGDAWCAVRGCVHLADVGDLLTLPALLLAPVCWRPRRPPASPLRRGLSQAALPIAALACVATSPFRFVDRRVPCDFEEAWGPRMPLVMTWSPGELVPIDSPEFLETVWLSGPTGERVEVAFAQPQTGVVVMCPLGGLEPETEYYWSMGPFSELPFNQVRIPEHDEAGGRRFTTGPDNFDAVIATAADCRAFDVELLLDARCEGDSGFER